MRGAATAEGAGRAWPNASPVAQAEAGVVLSSRVRLARNVSGFCFPSRAEDAELDRLVAELAAVLKRLPELADARLLRTDAAGGRELASLAESWLVSSGVVQARCGGALIGSDGVAVMFNDEDHLRLQVVLPGLSVGTAWRQVQELDERIGAVVTYAYRDGLGYLTTCPSNLGTGLRASVMVALPGLHILGECEPVLRGLGVMGYAVRGVYGEGSEPAGPLFQLSNQATLGLTEEELIDSFGMVVAEVIMAECHARGRLREQQPLKLLDYCARSLALIRHARLISSMEALFLLGGLRLGVECGIVGGVELGTIGSLMVAVQPMHLAMGAGTTGHDMDRDAARAVYLQGELATATVME